MANIKSAKKRILTSEKRKKRNTIIKSSLKTATKKVINAIVAKEDGQKINDLQIKLVKSLDIAVSKGIIHKNTAARRKSNIAKKINAITQ
jgi:small subunit ribosomal protein S20